MGSTSAQGWCLFAFLLGFTLGPAGLFALGWPVTVLGFALLAGSLAGFRRLREPVTSGPSGTERARTMPATQAVKSF